MRVIIALLFILMTTSAVRAQIPGKFESKFEAALFFVLDMENGYVNDPSDPGGPTNLGISLTTLRKHKIDINKDGEIDIKDVKELTLGDVVPIYRNFYWNALRLDEYNLYEAVVLFDTAVHTGVSRTRKWIHMARFSDNKNNDILTLRVRHYMNLINRNPSLRKFQTGWVMRVVELKKYVDYLKNSDIEIVNP